MMLVEGYTFEMQGRVADAIELCETAVEVARLSANPHHLFWALFELAHAHYFAGDLEAAIAAGEESARVGGRLATMPAAGGGPGWILGIAHLEAGDVERGREMMHHSAATTSRTRSRSSAASTGRSSRSSSSPSRADRRTRTTAEWPR